MKLFIAILSLIVLLTLSSCASLPTCPVSPPEDIIIQTGSGPIMIEKGMITPENYWTIPEWQKLVDEYGEYLRKQGGL